MNVLDAAIKCISIGFVAGFLAGTGPNLGRDILPLAALLAFVAAVLILFESSNLEPVTAEVDRAGPAVSTRAVGERGMNPG